MSSESLSGDDVTVDLRAVLAVLWAKRLRIVLVTLFALAATYAVLMFVPKMYESSASLLIESRNSPYTRASNDLTAAAPVDGGDVLVSSQIELIKSRDTIKAVIESENLRDVPELTEGSTSPLGAIMGLFGRKPAQQDVDDTILSNIESNMTVMRERDSRIVSIYVRTKNPELSARIANGIANAHVQRRAGLSLSDTANASVWLEEQIETLRKKVTEAEGKVADFRIQNDLFSGTNNTSLLDQQLSNIATQITSAQERKNTAQTKADLIRGLLERGQPIEGVPDVQGSVVVQQLSEEKARLQGERAQRLATLLANHPTVRALTAQIAEIDAQISAEGRRVAAALEAQAKIEADLEASLTNDLNRMKTGVSSATRETVTLNELEREATAQRQLLESYLLRYRDAVSRTDANSALPDVRVITLAGASSSPASPKTTLILGAVAIVTLAFQIGGIIFGELLSGRALAPRAQQRDSSEVEPQMAQAPAENAPAAPLMVRDTGTVPQPDAEPAPQPEAVYAVPPAFEQADDPAIEQEDYAYLPEIEDYAVTDAAPDDRHDERASAMVEGRPDTTIQWAQAEDGEQDDAAEMAPASAGWAEADHLHRNVPPALRAELDEDHVADHAANDLFSASLTAQDSQLLDTLSSDVALGRTRVILVGSLDSAGSDIGFSALLSNRVLDRGISVVLVDAGSRQESTEPGVTDLSHDYASFGDVIYKGAVQGLDEVPWGQQRAINRRSTKPFTLVEALTDIYELVIVRTGELGIGSSLPLFVGLNARVVITGDREIEAYRAQEICEDIATLGFADVKVMTSPIASAEVA